VPNLNHPTREELPEHEELFAMYEQLAGFVPNAFLVLARRPGIMHALRSLLQEVMGGSVPRTTKSLVALMASYGAGCRYCQAHQAAALVNLGLSAEKLAAVPAFETSEHFSEPERAAMRLALAAGAQPNTASAAHFAALGHHFDDGEIVEIVAVIAAFGFLNRWHETMATELEAEPLAVAHDVLGGLEWTPGRHAPAPVDPSS
jgi:uncharacterized peroxidase-related enzyme